MQYTYIPIPSEPTAPFILLGQAIVCKSSIAYLVIEGGTDAKRIINIGLHDGTTINTTIHAEQLFTEIVKELNGVANVRQDGQQDD